MGQQIVKVAVGIGSLSALTGAAQADALDDAITSAHLL